MDFIDSLKNVVYSIIRKENEVVSNEKDHPQDLNEGIFVYKNYKVEIDIMDLNDIDIENRMEDNFMDKTVFVITVKLN